MTFEKAIGLFIMLLAGAVNGRMFVNSTVTASEYTLASIVCLAWFLLGVTMFVFGKSTS